jgi:8-oxo-dGTP pyrophosphatase MutT (NUDIX family)
MMPRLKGVLSARTPQLITGTTRIPSAVLIPVFEKDNDYFVVFTERTQRVSTHKGQISFPGGRLDETDPSLLEAALRECEEEIGIARSQVEVLGRLDDCLTLVSNYIITPFVGAIPPQHDFSLNEIETASIIEVPVSDLIDPRCLAEGSEIVDGRIMPAYFYAHGRKVIWGATARILKQFLEIWQAAARGVVSEGTR